MTREDKIAAIIQAIQTDATLFALMRIAIAQNLPNIEDARLDMLMYLLGLPNG